MSAATIVRDWQRCLHAELLPDLHGHQARALADLSFGIALSGQCQSGHVAPAVPGAAKPASVQRRCERFLANGRIRPRLALWRLAKNLLAPWAGRRVRLLLDETPKANDLRVLKVSVAYRKRAVPVFAVCYRPGEPPLPLPQLIPFVLRRVHAGLPARAHVTLLADRGLAWPVVLDTCVELGWHYLLRLQGGTKVTLPDGREVTARELVGRVGGRWLGEAWLFKKAGWRAAAVLAYWPWGRPEPWLLVSDERACPRRFATYGQRTWTEELFRDEKSQGLNWQKSRVNEPARAERLLLLLALALILAILLGVRLLKRGWRRELETGRRRGLSVVQLGLRWLRYVISHDLPLKSSGHQLPLSP
jgi:Transposase DDE domain